jgi:hypothetical protein
MFGPEHLVEWSGELGVAISDQESNCSPIRFVKSDEEVASLLGDQALSGRQETPKSRIRRDSRCMNNNNTRS